MFTVPAEEGAVYVVALPLAVWLRLNDPQEFSGVQLQSTPAFVGSFSTTAVMGEAVLTNKKGVG